MLTPKDIEDKEFSVSRFTKGYDQAEVDEFLDEVHLTFVHLMRERDNATRRVKSDTGTIPAVESTVTLPKVDISKSGPSMESIAMLLSTAEQARDKILADANEEAASLLAGARAEAMDIAANAKDQADQELKEARDTVKLVKDNANGEAWRVLSDARDQAAAKVSEANARKSQISARVDELTKVHEETVNKLRAALGQLQ